MIRVSRSIVKRKLLPSPRSVKPSSASPVILPEGVVTKFRLVVLIFVIQTDFGIITTSLPIILICMANFMPAGAKLKASSFSWVVAAWAAATINMSRMIRMRTDNLSAE